MFLTTKGLKVLFVLISMKLAHLKNCYLLLQIKHLLDNTHFTLLKAKPEFVT